MTSKAIIQSISSSSSDMITTYDVFVNFRGYDIRNNFADHLFAALHRKGIHFFKDDTKLQKGKQILPELMQAIEGSHILIVVFSKEYASSKWCLRELVKIASYVNISGKHVLPIFYDVDPSEVRNQSGNYETAFANHKERYKDDKMKMEEVQRWREALTQTANLSGWHISDKPQDAEIGEIVREIIKRLNQNFPCRSNDDVVGMESRVKELEELLFLSSNDVRLVGIYGMPGIGKTTLARALYGRIYHRYDLHCFMDDVRKSFLDSGTLGAQRQLLCQALNEKDLELHNVYAGTHSVTTRLRYARVLIVLDNVDEIDQLNKLALDRTCLGAGSRIIIISTNEHILRTYKVDDTYRVQPLNHNNAVRLFCRNAFKDNYIRDPYKYLTDDVLSYAGGHPLAIKVLGSYLFGRDVSHWRSALARLRVNPNKNIMDVLRISFDGLDDETEKEIFLDIACLFNRYSEQFVKEVLDFRGFYPEIGLRVLVEKSLITVDQGIISMHELLVALGRHIVKEKSPKMPGRWSRLWDEKDLHKVMSDKMATNNLEAIVIEENWGFLDTPIRVDNLSEMNNLKLLRFNYLDTNYFGNLNHLSNELGYLTWDAYPFDCLPQSFQPENLVELSISYSSVKKLWEGRKLMHNLRRLDLSYSTCLIEMPYVGEAPNLEILNLEGCKQLRKIDKSIGLLRKLTELNLKGCINLVSLPNNILNIHSLECLNVSGCSKLYENQSLDERRDGEHLKKLCLDEAPIHSQSTSSIFFHSGTNKDSVVCLFHSSSSFFYPCMRELDLSFCNLIQIPDAIGNLRCLERLNLMRNNFATLPSLKELSKLIYLNLEHCTKLKYVSQLPSRTELSYTKKFQALRLGGGLRIYNCPDLVEKEHCNSKAISWMMQLVQAVVVRSPTSIN